MHIDLHQTCGCGQERSGLETAPSWARISGYDVITWLEGPLNPARVEEIPALNSSPRTGERYYLLVGVPFSARQGEPFWSIFTPALSHYNGWSEFPDELRQIVIVRCSLVEDCGSWGETMRQVAVKVEEVVPIQEISNRFEADSSGEVPQIPVAHHSCGRVERAEIRLYEGNFESDLGGWILTHRGAMVLHGSWDFHHHTFHAGHRPLTTEEQDKLDEGFAVYPWTST